MNTDTQQVAARLVERIADGDTLAVIEAQELLDDLCDECERVWTGDPLHVDYGAASEGHTGLLSVVTSLLFDQSEGGEEAETIALLYRINGGREVRYAHRRIIVWQRGADPTWEVFDRRAE